MAAVALASLLPLAVTRFPPSADLYQWIFQGAVLAQLFGWTGDFPLFAAAYEVIPAPVPNLGAPLNIALLTPVLGPLNAGRAIFALCALVFGLGFAYLVRGVQRRPTALEALGFAWAYGYMMYGGYISNHLAVGMAFFTVGRLVRSRTDDGNAPSRRDLVVLSVLGVLTYLAHLLGWAIVVVAVAVYAFELAREQRRWAGLLLLGTQLPALLLCGWYALIRIGAHVTTYYSELNAKIWSFVEPLMFFLRTDPFPPSFPLILVNLVCALVLLAIVVAEVGRTRQSQASRRVMVSGVLLLALAAVLPFHSLGGAGHPDERLVLPGLLLVIAALPVRRWSRLRAWTGAGVVCAILALHCMEYRAAGGQMAQLWDDLERAIPEHRAISSVTVDASDRESGCEPDRPFPYSATAVKWLGVLWALEDGGHVARLALTSIVRYSSGQNANITVWPVLVDSGDTAQIDSLRANLVLHFDIAVLLGCPEDLSALEDRLQPGFKPAAEGRRFVVLRNGFKRIKRRSTPPPAE